MSPSPSPSPSPATSPRPSPSPSPSPNANPQAIREHAGDRAGAAGGTRAGGTRADGMQAGDASVADRCEAARGRDEVTLILDEDGMIDMKDAEPCKLRLYMRALLYS